MQLFGFLTLAEKEWHRLLTSVQGVGAKAAMAILGALGPDGVSRAIAIGDAAAIRRAPGVGPKLAQRVVHELKDKAPAVMAMAATGAYLGMETDAALTDTVIETTPPGKAASPPAAGPGGPATRQGTQQAQADALSALTNLGYAPSEAAQAVAQAAEAESDTPALIRAALKLLAPK